MKDNYGNQVTQPNWLTKSPWFGDMHSTERQITYPNYLEMRAESTTLKYQILGEWRSSSSRILSGSLIFDFSGRLEEMPERTIHVPTAPCEVTAIWCGKDNYFEQAYVTLRWQKVSLQTAAKRAVIPRKDHYGNLCEHFSVEKNLFALFDEDEYKNAFSHDQSYASFLDELMTPEFYETSNPLQYLPKASGILAATRTGSAAAIGEYDKSGSMIALHFDFMQLHSSGQDGEFEDDWEFAGEAKALRATMGIPE